MRQYTTYTSTEFLIPPTTGPVLVPTSQRPSWAQDETKFPRVAHDPGRGLVTERTDRKGAREIFKYNQYGVIASSSGTLLWPPTTTPSTFIRHHLSTASTWFDSLAESL